MGTEDSQFEMAARGFGSLVGMKSDAMRFLIRLAYGEETVVTHFQSLFQWDHSLVMAVGPLKDTEAARRSQIRAALDVALRRMRPFRRFPSLPPPAPPEFDAVQRLFKESKAADAKQAKTQAKDDGQAMAQAQQSDVVTELRTGDMTYLRFRIVHDKIPDTQAIGETRKNMKLHPLLLVLLSSLLDVEF